MWGYVPTLLNEAKIGLELCSSWTQHQQLADLWRSLEAFVDEKREGDKLDKSKAQKRLCQTRLVHYDYGTNETKVAPYLLCFGLVLF